MSAPGALDVLAALGLAVGAGCNSEPPSPPPAPRAAAPETVSAEAPHTAPCPEGMARVAEFCIDRYEAHLVEIEPPHAALPFSERPKTGVRYMAAAAVGTRPQAYLNRWEAERACQAAKKRLCRAREWYRACSGGGAGAGAGAKPTRFPYGNEEVAGRCNTGKEHLMSKLFGAETRYTYDTHYNNPRLSLEPGFLAPTGEYRDCKTEAGVHDLVGNLHEWVADPVTTKLAEEVPLEYGKWGLGRDGSGAFMGGYYSSHGEHGRGCAYVTATHSPDYHDYSIGFRCCSD